MRRFRSTDSVYENVRAQLDAALGYPNAETKTETAIPPAADCPHDETGRVYLAVQDDYCEYILPSALLAELLASGNVQEITEQEWAASLPQPQEPPAGG